MKKQEARPKMGAEYSSLRSSCIYKAKLLPTNPRREIRPPIF